MEHMDTCLVHTCTRVCGMCGVPLGAVGGVCVCALSVGGVHSNGPPWAADQPNGTQRKHQKSAHGNKGD